MRARKFGVIALLLWPAITVIAVGQESPFRHLTENTMAVVHVRVEPLFKSAWGKAALDEVLSTKEAKDSFLKIKAHTAIDPLEVEGVTLIFLDPVATDEKDPRPFRSGPRWNLLRPTAPIAPQTGVPPESRLPSLPMSPPPKTLPPNPRSAAPHVLPDFVSVNAQVCTSDPSAPLVIITMRKAIDRKLFMRKRTDQDSDGTGPGTSVGLQFLSDTSFVLGPDHAVVQFAASTSDKESELGRLLTQQNSDAMIQGGYRLTPQFRKSLAADASAQGQLSMLFPLFNLSHATFAIDFGKQADVKFRLQAANEKQANLAAQSAKTLLALAEAHCEKAIPEIERSGLERSDVNAQRETRDEIALAKALQRMASSARVELRHSAEVAIALQMDVNPKHLAPLVRGMLQWNPTPRLAAH